MAAPVIARRAELKGASMQLMIDVQLSTGRSRSFGTSLMA